MVHGTSQDRISTTSSDFAKTLFDLLEPHLPEFPYPASLKKSNSPARRAHSLNSNIRLYKYTPGQHFGAHYDESVKDTVTGARSEWTLLIYLSGVEDEVTGGEVRFFGCFSRVLIWISMLRRVDDIL